MDRDKLILEIYSIIKVLIRTKYTKIYNLARKLSRISVFDYDDIQQELIVHVMNRLSDKSITNIYGYTKKLVHDKLIDMIRYHDRRVDIPVFIAKEATL